MKNLLLFASALLGIATTATAQNQPTALPLGTAPIGLQTQRLTAAEIVPEQQADQMASLLSGQLSLSPEQTARVRAAALTQSQEGRALLVKHNTMQDHSKLQEEDAAIRDKYEGQLKAILTPAQYERHLMIQARFRRIKEQAAAQEKAGR